MGRAGFVACGDRRSQDTHPKGEFAILNKKVNPIYVTHKSGRGELRGPSSPIGDRYMAFHPMAATSLEFTDGSCHWVQIRAAVSLGCVRMLNSHIRQLFDAVDVGTRLEFAADQASGRTVSKISLRISPAP